MKLLKGFPFIVFTVFTLFTIAGLALASWWLVGPQALLSPIQYAYFSFSLEVGALIGGLLSCRLLSSRGRHWTLNFSCLPNLLGWFCMVPVIKSMTSYNVPFIEIMFGRILTGFSLGLMVPSGIVYLIESAPSSWTGIFGCLAPFGLLCGSTLGHSLLNTVDHKHFVFVGSILIVTTNFALLWLPESPKWLAKAEHLNGTFASNPLLDQEYEYQEPVESESLLKETDQLSDSVQPSPTRLQRCLQNLFNITPMSPTDQSNLHLAWRLLAMQQLTAVGPLLNFCESVFTFGGPSWIRSYALLIGVPQTIFLGVTVLIVDLVPRKKLLYCSSFIMALAHLLLGVLLKFDEFKPVSIFTILCISVGLVGYSVGWGPIPILTVAELFKTEHRGFMVSSALIISWILHAAAVLSFEPLCALFGVSTYMWISSFTCLLLAVYVHQHIPETNSLSSRKSTTENISVQKAEIFRFDLSRKSVGQRMKGV